MHSIGPARQADRRATGTACRSWKTGQGQVARSHARSSPNGSGAELRREHGILSACPLRPPSCHRDTFDPERSNASIGDARPASSKASLSSACSHGESPGRPSYARERHCQPSGVLNRVGPVRHASCSLKRFGAHLVRDENSRQLGSAVTVHLGSHTTELSPPR
jgi:hypothetical protein